MIKLPPSLSDAIRKINPKACYKIKEQDIDQITWISGTTPISKADIEAKQIELQAEYDAQDYARKREKEYPSVQDLVVALYDTEDKAAIDAKRAEIKLKYPKPGA
jgi:proline dehydrogenase